MLSESFDLPISILLSLPEIILSFISLFAISFGLLISISFISLFPMFFKLYLLNKMKIIYSDISRQIPKQLATIEWYKLYSPETTPFIAQQSQETQ